MGRKHRRRVAVLAACGLLGAACGNVLGLEPTPPVPDAAVEAGPNDSGTIRGDTGSVLEDSGPAERDTGALRGDTGTPGGDTGAPGGDTGAPGGDTGTPGGDTGTRGGDTGPSFCVPPGAMDEGDAATCCSGVSSAGTCGCAPVGAPPNGGVSFGDTQGDPSLCCTGTVFGPTSPLAGYCCTPPAVTANQPTAALCCSGSADANGVCTGSTDAGPPSFCLAPGAHDNGDPGSCCLAADNPATGECCVVAGEPDQGDASNCCSGASSAGTCQCLDAGSPDNGAQDACCTRVAQIGVCACAPAGSPPNGVAFDSAPGASHGDASLCCTGTVFDPLSEMAGYCCAPAGVTVSLPASFVCCSGQADSNNVCE